MRPLHEQQHMAATALQDSSDGWTRNTQRVMTCRPIKHSTYTKKLFQNLVSRQPHLQAQVREHKGLGQERCKLKEAPQRDLQQH